MLPVVDASGRRNCALRVVLISPLLPDLSQRKCGSPAHHTLVSPSLIAMLALFEPILFCTAQVPYLMIGRRTGDGSVHSSANKLIHNQVSINLFIHQSNRTSAQQVPYLTTGRRLGGPPPPPSRWHAGSPPAGGCQPSDCAAPAAVICSPPDSAVAAAAAGSSPGKQPLRVAPLGARYAAQAASLARRVTAGKSAIHGFGAFTKLPHAAGIALFDPYKGTLLSNRWE